MKSEKILSAVLKRDGNNFDLLRLLAAVAVIVGHSYAISPQPPHQDFVLSVLHFDYSGSLAVKFFFFLSGLLVTNSIISKPEAFRFLIKRGFRIFPGLLACLLISVFVIGPLFTKLPLGEYFSTPATWAYLIKNFFLMNMVWRLPGVFDASPHGLNGSLWTLPHEVLCYLFIAIFYGLGLLKNKIVANIFFLGVLALSFIAPNYLPAFFSQNPEAHLLPGCFSLGALFANNKTLIPVHFSKVILLWLLVLVLQNSPTYQFFFYLALFYTALSLSSLDFVKTRLKLPFDASYGVYVYGFMIQQCLHAVFPNMGVYAHQFVAVCIALTIGILSWFFVEKRFIEAGNTICSNNHLSSLKIRQMTFLRSAFQGKALFEKNIFVFVCLSALALLMHIIVLRFIFPGYYSPLYPQHSDFYIPVMFANSTDTFVSLLKWPRPITMIFSKFIGYFGIKGSIAWVIAIVCINCALSSLLIKRILKLKFDWLLMLVFALYCGLLFSHPYFYIFYAQDIGAHLSYFFLILGAYGFYSLMDKSVVAASLILFSCSLLAFFSKETYALAALFIAFLWFIYSRKKSFLKAMMPLSTIALVFFITFLINVLIKSTFVNLNASLGSPYQISLNPLLVGQEFLRYAYEGLNLANLITISLLAYGILNYKKEGRKEFIFIIVGSVLGMGLALLPNSLLPNHHYNGYSFNGFYFFYLPLFILPVLYHKKSITTGFVAIVAVLCLSSPLVNIHKYKDSSNQWVVIQESTQRNLLRALDPLMNEIIPSSKPQKILIQGITFPFHPFVFPQSLRVFPNAKFAVFDVVNYNPSIVNNQRKDLVQFISATDTNASLYDKKWEFNKDGNLVTSVNLSSDRAFSKPLNKGEKLEINQGNFSQFTTAGFYKPENGIIWTNGNAFINLITPIENTDSIIINLNTYLPPICKSIVPKITLADNGGKIYFPIFSSRKENVFSYLFVANKTNKLEKVNITSDIIDASPDQRTLSFPFISMEIKR